MFRKNIWASWPAGFVDFQILARRSEGKELRSRDGRSPQEIFDMPDEWPEVPGA